MRATASEGHASIMLEFDGFDPDTALQDVREKVDTARTNCRRSGRAQGARNQRLAVPVLTIGLSGAMSERELVTIAAACRMPSSPFPPLEVDIAIEDLLEIVVDPQVLESCGIDFDQLATMSPATTSWWRPAAWTGRVVWP